MKEQEEKLDKKKIYHEAIAKSQSDLAPLAGYLALKELESIHHCISAQKENIKSNKHDC